MSDIAAQVGKKIREIRHAQGFSLEELAFKAELNAPHLGQIERGLQNPTVVTLKQICEALGVPVQLLFEEEPVVQIVPDKSPVLSKINAQLRAMTPNQQEDILKIIRLFRKNAKK